jgi:hypothetical protein
MDKQRPLSLLVGALCVATLVAVFGITASRASGLASEAAAPRPDAVVIDAVAERGSLELPPVTFLHDLHTGALKDQGKDCRSCHKERDGRLLTAFQRTLEEDAALDADGLKALYHENCFACHQEQRDAGNHAAPATGECRTCHSPRPDIDAARKPAGFDNALHARHFTSQAILVPGAEKNCAACHHVYDKTAGTTAYTDGEEATCRSCHQGEPRADADLGVTVRSFSSAAHEACVSCHLELEAKKLDTGPTRCAGCHGAVEQAKTAEANAKFVAKAGGETPLPPMTRKPEAALLLPAAMTSPAGAPAGKPLAAMPPVAFNHAKHEAANDTCRVCHTPDGKMGGKAGSMRPASAFDAMHATATDASCVGCHQRVRTEDASCAGCHRADDRSAPLPENSCGVCHTALPEGYGPVGTQAWTPSAEEKEAVAGLMLAANPAEPETFDPNAIPETVEIGVLSREYAASPFPHRKIVLKLLDGMQDSSLAAAFHSGEATMCQGCHHNSPRSMTPPACASCHAADPGADAGANLANQDRPALKAAYHDQCMSCHAAMGITGLKKGSETLPAQSCVACHDPKNP